MHTARRGIDGKRLLPIALALPQTEVCQHRRLPVLAYVVGCLCLYGTSSYCHRFISFLLLCSFSTSHRPLPTRKEISCIGLGEESWKAEGLLLVSSSLGLLLCSTPSCYVAKKQL